jgi:hypothetical protein
MADYFAPYFTADYSDEGYWVVTMRDSDGMPHDESGEFATEDEALRHAEHLKKAMLDSELDD